MSDKIISKLKAFYKFALSSAKNVDYVGMPINLNFNGKEKFTTFIGGISTLVMIGFILQYAYGQIAVMVNRDSTVVNSDN